MKTGTKIVTALLCASCMFGALTGCGGEQEENIPKLPDYTQTDAQYDFFAYNSPMKRTVESYTEYLEAGFNMMMLNGSLGYTNSLVWDECEAKTSMENAYQAGVRRIIMPDKDISALLENHDADGAQTLVGEGEDYKFATNNELVAYIKSNLETYADQPGFYGLSLKDEPTWQYTEVFGLVYQAIRTAGTELGINNIYIHMNLLPLGRAASDYAKTGTYTNLTEAYTSYVRGYLASTEADRISVDIYAFRGSGFASAFYSTLQIISSECAAAGAEFTYCLQSFEETNKSGDVLYRKIEKSDMTLELNTLMGMGVNAFAYYTYDWRDYLNGAPDSAFLNGEDGSKTEIYYYAQELMAKAQKMAKPLSYYDYQGMKLYTSDLANFNIAPYLSSAGDKQTNSSVAVDNSYSFKLLKDLQIDNDVAFVTELKDEANDLYMYMLQNVIDPINGKDGNTAMTVTADFGDEYTYVAEYEDGDLRYVKLNGGKYTKALSAGYAVYVVPLK